jgi:hypothetical protein
VVGTAVDRHHVADRPPLPFDARHVPGTDAPRPCPARQGPMVTTPRPDATGPRAISGFRRIRG